MGIVNFIPKVWSANILQNLRNTLVYGGLGNRDYEGDIANAGDTVHIISFTDPAVRSYTKNSDISWDLLTDADRTLVIDQGDYFAFTVDDVDRRQALPGFVAKATQGAAYNLANEVDSYVSGLCVTATDQTAQDLGAYAPTVANADMYDVFVDLRKQLNRSKVPAMGRWVVVPPEIYSYLLKDEKFINAQKSADGGRALHSGLIGGSDGYSDQPAAPVYDQGDAPIGWVGSIAGFDVYESNTVPEPTVGTWHVIAGHSIAFTFADQILETEAIRLQNQFGDGIRGLHVYGAKVVYPTALALASVTPS